MSGHRTIRIPSMNIEFFSEPLRRGNLPAGSRTMNYEGAIETIEKLGDGWRIPEHKEMVFIEGFCKLKILNPRRFVSDYTFWVSDESERKTRSVKSLYRSVYYYQDPEIYSLLDTAEVFLVPVRNI